MERPLAGPHYLPPLLRPSTSLWIHSIPSSAVCVARLSRFSRLFLLLLLLATTSTQLWLFCAQLFTSFFFVRSSYMCEGVQTRCTTRQLVKYVQMWACKLWLLLIAVDHQLRPGLTRTYVWCSRRRRHRDWRDMCKRAPVQNKGRANALAQKRWWINMDRAKEESASERGRVVGMSSKRTS